MLVTIIISYSITGMYGIYGEQNTGQVCTQEACNLNIQASEAACGEDGVEARREEENIHLNHVQSMFRLVSMTCWNKHIMR